jgi:hypothetical protein
MNIDDGDDPKVRRKSFKMEMWVQFQQGGFFADCNWLSVIFRRRVNVDGEPRA